MDDKTQDVNPNAGQSANQPVYQTVVEDDPVGGYTPVQTELPVEQVPPVQAAQNDTQLADSAAPANAIGDAAAATVVDPAADATETHEDITLNDLSDYGRPPPEPPEEKPPFTESPIFKYGMIGGGVFLALIICAMVFGFLFSVLRPQPKVALEYWGLWENEQTMKTVIQEYQTKNPGITINYKQQKAEDYREILMARGKEGRIADIFRYHNTWLPMVQEIAAPLPSSVMTNAEFEKTFYPVAQSDLKSGDSYFGIPLMIDGLVLVYNEDLFKNAGITQPPKTWEDVVEAAVKLRFKDPDGNLVTSGISLGTAENIEHFSDILGWMLLQNGASLSDLSTPQAVEALSNYRKFAEDPLLFWSEKVPQSNLNVFVQGKLGMVMVPSWQILEMKIQNPNLNLKVVPLPILPGGSQISLASYWVEGVSKSSRNQAEAWKFLAYLSTKETMTKLYQEQAKLRPFGEPYSRVDLRDSLLTNPYVGAVVAQAPFMKSMPLAGRTYDNGLNDEIITYLRNAVNSTIQGVSYQEAFQTAAQGVQQVFTKYGIQ